MPETPIRIILNDIRDYYGLPRIPPSGLVPVPPNEKVFPISRYQVEKLRVTPTGQVALKVENLLDHNNVFITWITYDSTLTSTTTTSYWVLPPETVTDIIVDVAYPCRTARVAKDASGVTYIFLNKTTLSFKRGGGGSVPAGTSGAVVVPPPPPPVP
jgi:hypothetical protein